jgi:acyl-CoA thioester hydrolase
MFERTFTVGWADMDMNGHMKNTAYMDRCGDVRMMFFAEQGFSMREFEERGVGPVIQRDDLEYYRERRLLEPVRVTLQMAGLSADASRFLMRNEFHREDGKLVARVTSTGGWLGLAARRLVAPPDALADVLRSMDRTPDWQEVTSSLRP